MAIAEEVYSAPNKETLMEQILTDSIAASNLNPRRWVREEPLNDLAESIKLHGILEPVILRPVTPAGARGMETPIIELQGGRPKYQIKYELLAGERRWCAAKLVGLTHVPAIVRTDVQDDGQALQLMLVENLQRADLDPVEEAEAYKRLQEMGMKQAKIAERVHRAQPTVANRMRLLDLPPDVQQRIKKGPLTAAHGVELASYKGVPAFVSALAAKAEEYSWTSHQIKQWDTLNARWELEKAGVIKQLGYGQLTEKCRENCHEAYLKSGYGYDWCLKPECYTQKKEKCEAADRAKVQQILDQAKAKGETLLKLSDLSWDSYEQIYANQKFPGECLGRLCEKLGKAVDGSGHVCEICPDKKCWQRHQRKDSLAKGKSDRACYKLLLKMVPDAVDEVQVVGSRELAIIASAALLNSSSDIRSVVSIRQGKPEINSALQAYRLTCHEKLAELTPLEIIKATLEILLLDELRLRYKSKSTNNSTWTDWYFKPPKAEAEAPTPPVDPEQPIDADEDLAMGSASEDAPEPKSAVCGQPAIFALYFKNGNREQTVFSCAIHQLLFVDEMESQGWKLRSGEIMAQPATGKIQCKMDLGGQPSREA